MADLSSDDLEKLIDDLTDMKRREGDATGALEKTIKNLKKQMDDLGDKADRSAKGFRELDSDVRRGRRSILDNASEIDRLTQLYEDSGRAMDSGTAKLRASLVQQAGFAAALKFGTDALQAFATAQIDLTINQYKALYDGLLKGTNAFDMSTKMQINSIDATLKFNQALSKGGEEVGTVLVSILPGQFKFLGLAVVALSKIFGYVAEKQADLAKFGVETLNSELQKTITSFGEASHAGVFLANGMSGLKQLANDSGMSVKAFTATIKNLGPELAMIGGNAGAGAQKLGQVYKAMEPYRRGLLNLGITQEEQLQGTVEYMEMQRRAGTLELKSREQLAKETDTYLTSLKVISSITGEDAKAAQKRARDAATQTRVQTLLQQESLKGNKDATAKFQQGIAAFGPEMKNALGQIMDAGDVTDVNMRAALEQTPTFYKMLKDYAADIKDGSISQEEAKNRFIKRYQESAEAISQESARASEGVGRAGLLLGKYGEMNAVLQAAQQGSIKALSKDFGAASDAVENQKNTTDPLTKSVSNATVEFNKMQAVLESDLLPALKDFAKVAMSIVEENKNRLAAVGLLSGQSADVRSAEEKRDAAYKGAGFWQKWYQMGRTEEQKAADKNLDVARGWDPNQSYDVGGIATGPKSGYNATLHGTEAVVPLPGGRAIPVELDLSELKQTMREFVDIAKDQRDIQERLLNNSY